MSRRVVSLVPSVTETLLRWGVVPVACTRFCEQPDLPHVGGTKDPDVAAIIRLAPDLVVMCEEENREEDARDLAAAGISTAALSIESVGDVEPAMAMLAALVDVDITAHRPRGGFAPSLPAPESLAGKRVFVPIWKRPWMTLSAATYGSSLLVALGLHNVFAGAGKRYPETTLEEAAGLAPDLVLAPSEPYPFRERHIPVLSEVAPVVLIDGQDLFWWGARTPEALRRLGERLVEAPQ